MLKESKSTSMEEDKLKTSKKYFVKIKWICKFILFIFILLFSNIGAKYPAMSETTLASNDVEIYKAENDLNAEYQKYVKLYNDIYRKSFIQQIEFESEIIIPDYVDFKYVEYAYKTSEELNISPRVTFRLIFKESSFVDTVISRAGAKGMMQLMPSTRKMYYDNLRIDTLGLDKTQEDIYIGLNYLKDMCDFWRSRGNSEKNLMMLSIAAYNAGPDNVIKYKGMPPFRETIDFVSFILKPHSNPTFYSNIIQKNKSTNKDVS